MEHELDMTALAKRLVRQCSRLTYEPGIGIVYRQPTDPYNHDFSGFFQNTG